MLFLKSFKVRDLSFAFDVDNRTPESSKAEGPEAAAGAATRPTKLAVCITGQLGRLELDSKIRNIINPAVQAGMDV